LPGVYGTSASAEVSVLRSQGSVSWSEIYTLQSVSPAQVTLRSYGSASVSAAYTGPLPGTLCYDGSCQQAPPGPYTAPAEQVLNTWTDTYTRPCAQGETGSVTVTEWWQSVKYWTPSAGGLSSRGTLRFTSAVRDEMLDYREYPNCTVPPPSTTGSPSTTTGQSTTTTGSPATTTGRSTTTTGWSTTTTAIPSTTTQQPMGNLTLTAVLATPLGGDPDPDVEADGSITIPKRTWGSSTYQVPAGVYTVSARPISGGFTSQGRSYTAQYTPSVSQASVLVPPGGTGGSTVTYTVVNGTFCDYGGCRSVRPGVYDGTPAPPGDPQTQYDSTEGDTHWYITWVTETYETFVHYFDPPYGVSSGQTVNAPHTTYGGLVYHRITTTKKDKRTGETTTVMDVEHHFDYEYIRKDTQYCWAMTYSRSIDRVSGYDTGDQYPNTCVN
jgi:hypothetical protein